MKVSIVALSASFEVCGMRDRCRSVHLLRLDYSGPSNLNGGANAAKVNGGTVVFLERAL